MSTATSSKKKKGKKNKKNGASKNIGSSDKKYDVAKSMIKSEKLYDELMSESMKALQVDDDEWDESTMEITTEYIVAARCIPGSISTKASGAIASASDWVPVAQIVIVRPVHLHEEEDESDELNPSVRATISYYCREISYTAALQAPTLKSLPRSMMQYSAEPLDSFVKYVYEDVIEGKSVDTFIDPNNAEGGAKVSMTKSKAREILVLEPGCKDATLIKKAYKQQSMLYHPDRFIGSDKTKEEIDKSTARFGLVKMAFLALSSGVRSEVTNGEPSSQTTRSWYESLGGKARSDFVGPIDLISVEKASLLCNKAFKCAVVGLDSDLTMSFIARNNQQAVMSR